MSTRTVYYCDGCDKKIPEAKRPGLIPRHTSVDMTIIVNHGVTLRVRDTTLCPTCFEVVGRGMAALVEHLDALPKGCP